MTSPSKDDYRQVCRILRAGKVPLSHPAVTCLALQMENVRKPLLARIKDLESQLAGRELLALDAWAKGTARIQHLEGSLAAHSNREDAKMHEHIIEDERGDAVDAVHFCCDGCHRRWCEAEGVAYRGWNGCHESPDGPAWCAWCGVLCGGALECGCLPPFVVSRLPVEAGEKCEHGGWLLLPCERVK
jgi:hypothetical protein